MPWISFVLRKALSREFPQGWHPLFYTGGFGPSPYNGSMSKFVTSDPEILGGTPVFVGTRVPVATLFEYLESNFSLEEFLENFPSVSGELAKAVLEESKTLAMQSAAA